jgi:hypothetical protein
MNELSVYERITDPLKAIETLGEVLAKSRIFGCESIEQGKVMAWECLARRTPPLQLKETYHLINTGQGATLTMRADAMLAGFLSIGGRHRIIERTGDRAAVELTHGGQTVEFECTLADAKEAGLTEGKKGEKENWSSPRQRMQMLWARVISDGVRAMAPQVCAGKYTPDDFGQQSESDESPHADSAMVVDGETVTSYVVESQQPPAATVKPAVKQPDDPAPGECTAAQRRRITDLFEQLGLSLEQRSAVLTKRGVSALRSLTEGKAAELLTNLERKAVEVLAGSSKQPPEANAARVDGPASQGQVDELKKDLLPMLAQGNQELYQRLVAKMKAAGLKFADLSFEDARSLIEQIKMKNLEAFFAASLVKHTEPAATPADPS